MGDNSRGLVYLAKTHVVHQHGYRARFMLGCRRIELLPGDFTVTPAGVRSSYTLPANGFHLCIHFMPVAARKGGLRLPLHWRPGALTGVVAERFQRTIDLFRRSQRPGAEGRLAATAASASLQEFLVWTAYASIQTKSARDDSQSEQALMRLVRILDTEFEKDWTIPELASEVGLSQNYLAHRFRERMGITIQKYLLNRRIETAGHLLTTTRMTVKEIGAAVGLPDPQYFNKQFRRMAGKSPMATRLQSSE